LPKDTTAVFSGFRDTCLSFGGLEREATAPDDLTETQG
jgi:hypothetical protein